MFFYLKTILLKFSSHGFVDRKSNLESNDSNFAKCVDLEFGLMLPSLQQFLLLDHEMERSKTFLAETFRGPELECKVKMWHALWITCPKESGLKHFDFFYTVPINLPVPVRLRFIFIRSKGFSICMALVKVGRNSMFCVPGIQKSELMSRLITWVAVKHARVNWVALATLPCEWMCVKRKRTGLRIWPDFQSIEAY